MDFGLLKLRRMKIRA